MSKEEVLGRVREALSVPSHPQVRALAGDGIRNPREARKFMPPGGDTFEERFANFSRLGEKLKVEIHLVPTLSAATDAVLELSKSCGWKKVASHHQPLTDVAVPGLAPEVIWMEDQPGTTALESCDAGISGCEALIAQTGSVLVTSKGSGGRALSVLPPHHVVLATRDQLLPDMLSGYDLLREKYGKNLPSFISFITGASRTGDIERILVLGAHGPKRLTVILIES
ncbi:LUD domain-containing protein [Kiritimatiellaeota bacterium B1221]|nr:LUD domain-containing protein [Kiritimatiellaeota bacterium B1221]